ncbi:MAG: hypothetical protein WBS22_17105 [Methylocystis sp.]|jgi:hypothetical protein
MLRLELAPNAYNINHYARMRNAYVGRRAAYSRAAEAAAMGFHANGEAFAKQRLLEMMGGSA